MAKRKRMDPPQPAKDLAGYNPIATAADCHYDRDAANLAVQFLEQGCCHVKGRLAGHPFLLEPWQKDLTRTLFGWKRPDGMRRYRQAYIEVARKNGKSSWLAGIVNMMMFCPTFQDPGAELYSAASDRDQASIVYNVATAMIRRQPHMMKQCKILDSMKRVVLGDSVYRAIPMDAGGSHGYHANLIAADELHAWKGETGREFWDVLNTSTGSRDEPLSIAITTAGYDKHSVCYRVHRHAEQVRDGIISDQAFLPVLFAAAEDDDWTDPNVWRQANPNLGVSVHLDYLKRECEKAQNTPGYENVFRRLHLSQWTEQDVRWLKMADWDACMGDEVDLTGRPCFIGLDLSTRVDITAAVLVFPPDDDLDKGYHCLAIFWVPEDNARKRQHADKVPYQDWIREGYIRATPGNVVDYDVVRRDLAELADKYEVQCVACDPWNAQQVMTQLGQDGLNVVEHRQGFASMSNPTKDVEKLVISHKLNHGGNPVLRWMASNVAVEQDAAGNIKPSKKRSSDKIDGVVALVMAIGQAARGGEAANVYDMRGVLTI